jgi:hypothetical protein
MPQDLRIGSVIFFFYGSKVGQICRTYLSIWATIPKSQQSR